QQLRLEGCEPAILLRTLQRECCCWLPSSARRRTLPLGRCPTGRQK
ncbi:hypothetical protein CK247_29980, partial [Klebsiella pneumoniae]